MNCSSLTSCSLCTSAAPPLACAWCTEPQLSIDGLYGGSGVGLRVKGCVAIPTTQQELEHVCEGGSLLLGCGEGLGSYTFLLVLASSLLCLCGLALAKRLVARWGTPRWSQVGGDDGGSLQAPLLGDDVDGHDAVLRSNFSDPDAAPWLCSVCNFENRPCSKHCDLCGTRESLLAVKKSREGGDDAATGALSDDESSLGVRGGESESCPARESLAVMPIMPRDRFDSVSPGSSAASSLKGFGLYLSGARRLPASSRRLTLRQRMSRRRRRWVRQVCFSKSADDGAATAEAENEAEDDKGAAAEEGRCVPSGQSHVQWVRSDVAAGEVSPPGSPAYFSRMEGDGRMGWHLAGHSDGDLALPPPPLPVQSSASGCSRSRRPWGVASTLDLGPMRGTDEWLEGLRQKKGYLQEIASRPFWSKHIWFLDQLEMLQVPYGAGSEAMRIEVRRDRLLEDSFNQIMSMSVGDLRRWLRVQFVDEPGVDAGGLEREWFELITEALFDPSTGLFMPQPEDGAYSISPASGTANEMHLEYFRLAGRILGKLLMEHAVTPYRLALPILQHILASPQSFSDLQFIDQELYRNLQWMRHHSVESLELDFSVAMESFGAREVVELLPGGSQIAVSDENKDQYLLLRFQHKVLTSVEAQVWHLLQGFYEVIPASLVGVFDHAELNYLLSGIQEVDVNDWRRHTSYHGVYARQGEAHHAIRWFWEIVEEMSSEDRSRLLQFCTGSSRLPPHGFKALQSNDGHYRRFSIHSIRRRDSMLPRSHACFSRLEMPPYESKKEMAEHLKVALNCAHIGFDMD
jgi:hypothetical protein